jgi:hypothetical protein
MVRKFKCFETDTRKNAGLLKRLYSDDEPGVQSLGLRFEFRTGMFLFGQLIANF